MPSKLSPKYTAQDWAGVSKPKGKIKHLTSKNQQRQEKNTAGFSCLIYQLGCCVGILLWWQSECSAGGTCSRRSGTWGIRGTWRFAGPIGGSKADTVFIDNFTMSDIAWQPSIVSHFCVNYIYMVSDSDRFKHCFTCIISIFLLEVLVLNQPLTNIDKPGQSWQCRAWQSRCGVGHSACWGWR